MYKLSILLTYNQEELLEVSRAEKIAIVYKADEEISQKYLFTELSKLNLFENDLFVNKYSKETSINSKLEIEKLRLANILALAKSQAETELALAISLAESQAATERLKIDADNKAKVEFEKLKLTKHANSYKQCSNSNSNMKKDRFCTYCNISGHNLPQCFKRNSHNRFTKNRYNVTRQGVAQNVQNVSPSQNVQIDSPQQTHVKSSEHIDLSQSLSTEASVFVPDSNPVGFVKSKDSSFDKVITSITLLEKGVMTEDFLDPLGNQMMSCGSGQITVGIVDNSPVSVVLGDELLGSRIIPDSISSLKLENDLKFESKVNPNPKVLCDPLETQNMNVNLEIYPDTISKNTPNLGINSHSTGDNEINLSDTFFAKLDKSQFMSKNESIDNQTIDSSLSINRPEKISKDKSISENTRYLYKCGILMRNFTPNYSFVTENQRIQTQIVLSKYDQDKILKNAHDLPMIGH